MRVTARKRPPHHHRCSAALARERLRGHPGALVWLGVAWERLQVGRGARRLHAAVRPASQQLPACVLVTPACPGHKPRSREEPPVAVTLPSTRADPQFQL